MLSVRWPHHRIAVELCLIGARISFVVVVSPHTFLFLVFVTSLCLFVYFIYTLIRYVSFPDFCDPDETGIDELLVEDQVLYVNKNVSSPGLLRMISSYS